MRKDEDKRETVSDDDKVIAPMNVDGMPWSVDRSHNKRPKTSSDHAEERQNDEPEPLTKKEMRAVIVNALGASLLIGGIFIAGLILFVLFCIHVWLR